MKIILLQDIKGLGKKFDVKEIKDGYVRNFLAPRGLAKIADEKSLKEIEIQKAEKERKDKETKENLEKLGREISQNELFFKAKTGEKKEVFGSVNKEMILAEIVRKHNAAESAEDIEIKLAKPIKTLGRHEVEIDLGKGIVIKAPVIVEPEQ